MRKVTDNENPAVTQGKNAVSVTIEIKRNTRDPQVIESANTPKNLPTSDFLSYFLSV